MDAPRGVADDGYQFLHCYHFHFAATPFGKARERVGVVSADAQFCGLYGLRGRHGGTQHRREPPARSPFEMGQTAAAAGRCAVFADRCPHHFSKHRGKRGLFYDFRAARFHPAAHVGRGAQKRHHHLVFGASRNGRLPGFEFFHHWHISQMEAAQYKIAAAEAQIEALKAQLDPHFMFNSLNTLTELVEINSSQSLDFLKSFGQVYRYVLQTREHESVTLQEELDFADSYLFLLKTRFGEALQVEKNIVEADLEKHLPPMTLQLLLENAVKHNVLTASKPLRVSLSTDGQWLTVQNNLQPKSSKGYSSGIGLKNITERVLRLTGEEPVIENGGSFFTVKIPLH